MALNPNEDTEFNDALRAHGILPPREKSSPSPSPPQSPSLEYKLSTATLSELKELEEEEFDSDTERVVASYRRQRLAELRTAKKNSRFGEVYPISREDYTKEVTDASKADSSEENIEGTGVVCLLYKDGQPESIQLTTQLTTLAKRYPRTKFVSIVGDKCIPNYSDKLCPTLIVYRGGEVTRQMVGWGGDRERTIAELEAVLILSLAITSPARQSDSGKGSDDEISEGSARRPSAGSQSNTKHPPNISDEDDSDFDL